MLTSLMPQKHVVQQGEDIPSIASQYGIRTWQRVWGLEENKALRQLRRDPYRLNPKDEVWVPEVQTKPAKYTTESTHDVKVKRAWSELSLRIEDASGAPLANRNYRFSRDGSLEKAGTTDGNGIAKLKVGAHNRNGRVVVLDDQGEDEFAIEIAFGSLDAPGTRSAVLAQARSLCPGLDASDEDLITHIQHLLARPTTGELDPQTMTAIEIWHTQGFDAVKKFVEELAPTEQSA